MEINSTHRTSFPIIVRRDAHLGKDCDWREGSRQSLLDAQLFGVGSRDALIVIDQSSRDDAGFWTQ